MRSLIDPGDGFINERIGDLAPVEGRLIQDAVLILSWDGIIVYDASDNSGPKIWRALH